MQSCCSPPGMGWRVVEALGLVGLVCLGGCFRPGGAHLIGLHNGCRGTVHVKFYSRPAKGRVDPESVKRFDLRAGETQDEFIAPDEELRVEIHGATEAVGSWTPAAFPRTLRGPSKAGGGYAVLDIGPDRLRLRNETAMEHMQGTGEGMGIAAAGCCLAPAFLWVLWFLAVGRFNKEPAGS